MYLYIPCILYIYNMYIFTLPYMHSHTDLRLAALYVNHLLNATVGMDDL